MSDAVTTQHPTAHPAVPGTAAGRPDRMRLHVVLPSEAGTMPAQELVRLAREAEELGYAGSGCRTTCCRRARTGVRRRATAGCTRR
ncbi:hypothetical protein O1L44_19280 [Streptomyces noursei]|nr:hypothetical protein [Streptomyces noursei]